MENLVSGSQPINVLFVEDEFFISEWVAMSLSEQGFAVHTAANARDALRYLQSAPVDVLMTDINLPGGMDGLALARRARELSPHLPVIYASAYASMLDEKVTVPGAICVAKPYETAVLGRLIASAIATSGTDANGCYAILPRARNSSSQWMW